MTNLTDLEIFARVVSAGSLSAAGRELDLSPAVVSKRLRRLEDKLGTRLLQRTTRQIALTEAGQGYFERVVPILAGIEEAEAYVMRRSTMARGTLKISAPTTFGRMHIAPHLAPFMRDNPDLHINLVLSDDLVDIVGDGFDLAIRIAALEDSSLVARRLASVKRILVASPDYISNRGAPSQFCDLHQHICLAPHNGEPWRLTDEAGEQHQHRPEGPLLTNSSEVIRQATLAGIGIALRSTWDISNELARGELVHILPDLEASRNVSLYAMYPSRRFLPAKVRLFIDFIASVYGSTPYWEREQDLPTMKLASG